MTPEMWLLLALSVFDGILTIWLFMLSQRTGKIEGLEDRVTVKSEAVVDARFQLLASDFTGLVGQLRTVIEGIEKRLERGDEAFDRQDEMQRTLEIQSERRQAQCMKTFATREDLTTLAEEVRKLEVKLARFEERIHGASREQR